MSTHEIDAPPTYAQRRARSLAESATKLRTDVQRARRDRPGDGERMVMGVRVHDVERILDGLRDAELALAAHARHAEQAALAAGNGAPLDLDHPAPETAWLDGQPPRPAPAAIRYVIERGPDFTRVWLPDWLTGADHLPERPELHRAAWMTWLAIHGIDPADVVASYPITIRPGFIDYVSFVTGTDEDGRPCKRIDPSGGLGFLKEQRTQSWRGDPYPLPVDSAGNLR